MPGFVMRRKDTMPRGHADTGGASRYFYQCPLEPSLEPSPEPSQEPPTEQNPPFSAPIPPPTDLYDKRGDCECGYTQTIDPALPPDPPVRFCYTAKASRKERNLGLDTDVQMTLRQDLTQEQFDYVILELQKVGLA